MTGAVDVVASRVGLSGEPEFAVHDGPGKEPVQGVRAVPVVQVVLRAASVQRTQQDPPAPGNRGGQFERQRFVTTPAIAPAHEPVRELNRAEALLVIDPLVESEGAVADDAVVEPFEGRPGDPADEDTQRVVGSHPARLPGRQDGWPLEDAMHQDSFDGPLIDRLGDTPPLHERGEEVIGKRVGVRPRAVDSGGAGSGHLLIARRATTRRGRHLRHKRRQEDGERRRERAWYPVVLAKRQVLQGCSNCVPNVQQAPVGQ